MKQKDLDKLKTNKSIVVFEASLSEWTGVRRRHVVILDSTVCDIENLQPGQRAIVIVPRVK